jgi:hypothetical protein
MQLKHSLKTGFSFGLTSGIITTLGLMVGLHAGTNSKMVVIGGILTIAIADAFSDALGIHISEESEDVHSAREIWESTFSTFFSKLVFALMFSIPVIFFKLTMAIIISVILGLSILGIISFIFSKDEDERWKVVSEHLIIAVIVILITHYVGDWISITFT